MFNHRKRCGLRVAGEGVRRCTYREVRQERRRGKYYIRYRLSLFSSVANPVDVSLQSISAALNIYHPCLYLYTLYSSRSSIFSSPQSYSRVHYPFMLSSFTLYDASTHLQDFSIISRNCSCTVHSTLLQSHGSGYERSEMYGCSGNVELTTIVFNWKIVNVE